MAAVVDVIVQTRPDILTLQGIDYDLGGRALAALGDRLAEAGHPMPHRFAARPNSGLRTGHDHDGDGRTTGARDAQGFGRFPGQGGMAVLSRYPIDGPGVRDFSVMLWADLPGAVLPQRDGGLFPAPELYEVQRLSSVAHWDVPVLLGMGTLHVLTFHATPPVFDGPEDRNGQRNRDELRLWPLYLQGALPGPPPPAARYVLMGDANLDPHDGEGSGAAMQALLAGPLFQDPQPASPGGAAAANPGQRGDPALDTTDWDDPAPGNLRVDYVLPSPDLRVIGAGIHWPAPGEAGAEGAAAASRHRLVWVDVEIEG